MQAFPLFTAACVCASALPRDAWIWAAGKAVHVSLHLSRDDMQSPRHRLIGLLALHLRRPKRAAMPRTFSLEALPTTR